MLDMFCKHMQCYFVMLHLYIVHVLCLLSWVNRLTGEQTYIHTLLYLTHLKLENPKRKITIEAELI